MKQPKMLALISSFHEEAEKIKKRGSVKVITPNGFYSCHNPEIVKLKLSMIRDEMARLRNKYNL